MAGCGVPVAGAGRASGAGSAGFRCTRWRAAGRAEVPKPAPHRAGVSRSAGTGRSHGRRRSWARNRARRSWVCAARISHVHRSAAAGSRSCGAVQPSVFLIILNVCPMPNLRRNVCRQRSTSAGVASVFRPPQPDRLRFAPARKMLDVEPDDGAGDDRQWAVVLGPGGPAGRPRMQPVPRLSLSLSAASGVGHGHRVLGAPRRGVTEDELGAMPGRPPSGLYTRGGMARRRTRSERIRPRISTGRSRSSQRSSRCDRVPGRR